MTKIGVLSGVFNLRRFIDKLRRGGDAKPESSHPLYRLAPARDLGVRRVRLSSLIESSDKKEGPSGGKFEGAVLNFPKPGKALAAILSFWGLESDGRREPEVRVARVQGKYIVEKGRQSLALASAMGLDYICARVTEYDYDTLKKKMRVFRFPEGTMVGVPTGDRKRYSYHGVDAGELDLLLGRHRIPLIDDVTASYNNAARVSMARAGGAAAPAGKKRPLKLVCADNQ